MGVIAGYLINSANPVTVGGTGTAAKYFPSTPVQPAWLSGAPGVNTSSDSHQFGNQPSSTSAAGQLVFPGDGKLDGVRSQILVTGTFGSDTGDPSGTVNIEVVANTGTVASPSYTVLASTSATVPTLAAAEDFGIYLNVFGSSKSGVLNGTYSAMINNVLVNSTPKALNNTLTGLNFAASQPFGLLVRVTFGTSDATNTASLTQFQVVSE